MFLGSAPTLVIPIAYYFLRGISPYQRLVADRLSGALGGGLTLDVSIDDHLPVGLETTDLFALTGEINWSYQTAEPVEDQCMALGDGSTIPRNELTNGIEFITQDMREYLNCLSKMPDVVISSDGDSFVGTLRELEEVFFKHEAKRQALCSTSPLILGFGVNVPWFGLKVLEITRKGDYTRRMCLRDMFFSIAFGFVNSTVLPEAVEYITGPGQHLDFVTPQLAADVAPNNEMDVLADLLSIHNYEESRRWRTGVMLRNTQIGTGIARYLKKDGIIDTQANRVHFFCGKGHNEDFPEICRKTDPAFNRDIVSKIKEKLHKFMATAEKYPGHEELISGFVINFLNHFSTVGMRINSVDPDVFNKLKSSMKAEPEKPEMRSMFLLMSQALQDLYEELAEKPESRFKEILDDALRVYIDTQITGKQKLQLAQAICQLPLYDSSDLTATSVLNVGAYQIWHAHGVPVRVNRKEQDSSN